MKTRTWLLLAITTSLSTTASAGQGVWTSNGPYSGNIWALALDPSHPSTLYAASYGGDSGVYKSTDGGGTWSAAGLSGGYVLSLAIDPSAPATIYAGTQQWGVFKSTNGGGSWSPVGLSNTFAVPVLAIDPSAPATVYAGTQDGVYKSINGGGSWTNVNAGVLTTDVRALAIDPSTPTTLYAASNGGVFKSANGGGSWAAISTGLTNAYVQALAIDPSAPATIYAAGFAQSGAGSQAYRSADGGETWTPINAGLPATYVHNLVLAASAPATIYAGTFYDGVFKSTNGGGSWSPINTGLTETYIQALAIDPSAPASLFAGTSFGGVFKSTNGGASWTTANTGMKSFVTALSVDPTVPDTLYAGTSSNSGAGGGVFKSTDGAKSWAAIQALYSELKTLAVDPSSDTLYAGASSDFYYDYPAGVFKSTDGGAHWTQSLSVSVYAVAIDPRAPATLYAGTGSWRGDGGGGIFKSANGGGTWSAVNAGLQFGTNTRVSALAIDPSTPATLYAGMEGGGGAFKSTDGGGSWSATNAGLTASNVYALAIDPSTPATLYAGTDGGVFKSTNGGAIWAAASTGLTNLRVNALAINPTGPATLYAGTDGGVFRSIDSGSTWTAFNTGLPSVPVSVLALDPWVSTLYAGLKGAGVWQLTASTPATVTALLPASAHSSGANGAFYTTDVSVANTGTMPATFTFKFLGHDQDGSSGPERRFNLDPGESRTFVDVLGSVFDQTLNYGAIRITSNTSTLNVVSVTSTPGFGGTFGQAIPAVAFADLIPAGSARSILYIREGDGFRSNLILASGSSVSTDVDVALVLPAGGWDYARARRTLATKAYKVPPNGMIQVNRVVRDMGISGPVTGARLVLSSSTAGALFTALASVIDERTNDPTVIPAPAASVSGSEPLWLLPSSVHSSGDNGAFYTTNVAVANVGAAPASFTMKFLGHGRDGSGSSEQNFDLESGASVTYFDVLSSVFHETSNYGAIRITPRAVGRLGRASSSPSLNVVSVTSTSGFGGTLSQTILPVSSAGLINAGSSRSILYIREGDGFRSNLVLASNASVPTTVEVALVSPAGETLASKSYSVPPNGMTQINRVVRDMGISGSITGARLVLSSSTPVAAFTAFASVIDEITNDPTAVEAR